MRHWKRRWLDSVKCLATIEPDDIHEAKKHKLYRLANDLVRAKLPPAELVFHPQFDELGQSLNEQPGLIAAPITFENQATEQRMFVCAPALPFSIGPGRTGQGRLSPPPRASSLLAA
jgi:hypothetical protein